MSSTYDITIASDNNLLAIFQYFQNTFPSTKSLTDFIEDFNIYLILSNGSTILETIHDLGESFEFNSDLTYFVSMNFLFSGNTLDPNQIIEILQNLGVLTYTVQIDCENYVSGNIDNITIHNGNVTIKTQKLHDEIHRLCTMGKAQEFITNKLNQCLVATKLITLNLESSPNYIANYSPTNAVYSPTIIQKQSSAIEENWAKVFESAMEKYPSIHMIEERIKNDIFRAISV